MTNKYTIEYRYDNYEEGCGCCSYSEQTLSIYDDKSDGSAVFTSDNVGVWAVDEADLREYINKKYPEYSDFEVHPNTRYF